MTPRAPSKLGPLLLVIGLTSALGALAGCHDRAATRLDCMKAADRINASSKWVDICMAGIDPHAPCSSEYGEYIKCLAEEPPGDDAFADCAVMRRLSEGCDDAHR